MSFEKNLESLRKQKGWSQDDLADKLNLTRQAVSKWETGSSKPDIDNVKNISQLFSVRIDDLLNNEVVEDKAVSLNFEKKEKRENIIKTIKFAIIALVIVYLITVIYKFASLLIIVNGVQKYANLNNYHYVIRTYENNIVDKKTESWFKDGVSKTVVSKFNDNRIEEQSSTYIDYEKKRGYLTDENGNNTSLDVDTYLISHLNYDRGRQLILEFPIQIRADSFFIILSESISINSLISFDENVIRISDKNYFIELDRSTLLPNLFYYKNKNETGNTSIMQVYSIQINTVENVEI